MRGIALRGPRVPKPEALICQLCKLSAPPAVRYRPQFTRSIASAARSPRRPSIGPVLSQGPVKAPEATELPSTGVIDLNAALLDIEHSAAALRNSKTVPSNEAILIVLSKCFQVVQYIVRPNRAATEKDNEISSLLDLDEKTPKKESKPSQAQLSHPTAERLSRIAYELLKDEKIFISPEALDLYVQLNTLLRRAKTFPEIFHLYANKPIPEENSSPIKYLAPNPKNINSAVPVELANMALDAAIEQRDLSLVLAIIDQTFCTSAFHRAKFFRLAAAPLGILAITPLGCYALASAAAHFQNTMEPSTATAIAFAASLAYVGGTSSVGLLAIVTANDHMERVVWTPGVPLRERWLREEERAAMDRVALAWGFKDIYMRGEEEGEEWECLREFIGMRGMILDKTDLMAGMQ